MMKALLLLFVVALASGSDLAQHQKDILCLLYKPNEPIRPRFTQLKAASVSYVPHDHADHFTDGGAAAVILDAKIEAHQVQPQRVLFSLFNGHNRADALMLFEVLLFAKDWETFVSSAAYYREQMNDGAFVYALYVAVIHSNITGGVVLPPLYEITPHMFTNSEVIQKAYSAKMTQIPGKFRMHFTSSKKNPEQRVAYFGEDIGMNVHHTTWHMNYPFWWDDRYGNHIDRKGEIFFWAHHQLAVRFDSERLSNNLNFVDELYWDKPIVDGFVPHTSYRYGGDFPARPDNVYFQNIDGIIRIPDVMVMQDRIRDAIAHGYVTAKDGSAIDIRNERGVVVLGDVMESSTYSVNPEYYGTLHNLAHVILGRQGDPLGKFGMPPSVMEHFETGPRDPAFFRLRKYIDNMFKEHKDSLPPYTNYEVLFPGISIDSVRLDGKLETFFEDFEFDINFAVEDTAEVDDVDYIMAVVRRLNHKNVDFHLDITNNNNAHEDVVGTVRLFLCPLRDANGIVLTLNEARWNCIEVDKFWTTLHPGVNHVQRNSRNTSSTAPDIPSFKSLWATTEAALADGTEPDFGDYSNGCGLPNRMLLPKGKPEGMEFTMMVAVTNGARDTNKGYEKASGAHTVCRVKGEQYPDKRPLGFPLDRRIPNDRIFLNYPNVATSVVKVTHIG